MTQPDEVPEECDRDHVVTLPDETPYDVIDRFDDAVDRLFAPLRRSDVANRVFYTASAVADHSLLWHLASASQGINGPVGHQAALRLSTALGVESALVNGLIKSLFRRQRPVVAVERPYRLRTPLTSSFPSGHASSAFMSAVLLGQRSRHPQLWYLLAGVVAVSRVHVRIHHGSDVIAGAALGVGLGRLTQRLWPLR